MSEGDALQRARINALLAWCEHEGYLVDPRAEILVHPGGWGVAATAPFDEGDIVAAMPQGSFLSVRTSIAPARLLEAETRMGPTLELAFVLLWELLQGPASRWWNYLFSLPDAEVLPPLWPWGEPDLATPDEQRWMSMLNRTRVGEICALRAKSARADRYGGIGSDDTLSFAALRAVLTPARLSFLSAQFAGNKRCNTALRDLHSSPPSDQQGWQRALAHCCAVVSSRAFVLDEELGLALCPVADVFNHRAPGENDVQLEVGADGMAVMRCTRALAPGEVYNAYGALGRAELLCRYGFATGLVEYGSDAESGSDAAGANGRDGCDDADAGQAMLDGAIRMYLAGSPEPRVY